MNEAIKQIAGATINTSAVGMVLRHLERRDRFGPGALRVLTYHRIGNPDLDPSMDRDLFSAVPEDFCRQMELLADCYRPVSIHQVVDAVDDRQPLPPRAVLVTFDDAYCDFAEIAWPVMRRLGIPATLFVPSAYPNAPDKEFWWDRLSRYLTAERPERVVSGPFGTLKLGSASDRLAVVRCLKSYVKSLPHDQAMSWVERLCGDQPQNRSSRPSVLSWSQLRQLSDEGVTIGVHTRTHPLLNRLRPELVYSEIAGAWEDIKAQVAGALKVFAYPGGAVSTAAREQLEKSGFHLAFTTQPGINGVNRSDPLSFRRTHVGLRTTTNIFRARLAAGW